MKYSEEVLSASVVDWTQDFIRDLQDLIDNRHSTDALTFAIEINGKLKIGHQEMKDLICDSGLDGRFNRRKGR